MMYLYGASGHGKVVAEIAIENQIPIQGFVDKSETLEECLGIPVYRVMPLNAEKIFISIGNNKIRKKLSELYARSQFISLLHPKANISKTATIDNGTAIMAGATVNACSKIGFQCIINTNASVDHDCVIGDYVHISPNVAIAGNVEIGEGTHIGIGACVIQGVKIGKWCVIGAGSIIIKDIPDGAKVVGNPGKIISQNNIDI